MSTLILVAVGISVLAFLLALRGAGDGHEDQAGFHPEVRAVFRLERFRPPGVGPHNPEHLHESLASAVRAWPGGDRSPDGLCVNRASLARGIFFEWAVPPVPAGNNGLPRTPFAWIRRSR